MKFHNFELHSMIPHILQKKVFSLWRRIFIDIYEWVLDPANLFPNILDMVVRI